MGLENIDVLMHIEDLAINSANYLTTYTTNYCNSTSCHFTSLHSMRPLIYMLMCLFEKMKQLSHISSSCGS